MAKKAILSVLFLFILISSFCSRPKEDILRVSIHNFTGYAPFELADKYNLYDHDKIHLIELASSTTAIRAMSNDIVDAAALTLDEALRLVDRGIEITIVLVIDFSNGADMIIGKPYIHNMLDLKNKKIGVEISSLGSFALLRALEKYNIRIEEISVSNFEVHEQVNAYKSNNFDAVVTHDPFSTKILNMGGRKLFSSKEIPYEISDVLVIRTDYLKKNPKNSRHLVESWYRALEYAEKNPENAFDLYSKYLGLSLHETKESFKLFIIPDLHENYKLLDSKNGSFHATVRKLESFMVKQNLLSAPHSLENFLSEAYLPEINASSTDTEKIR